MNIAEAQATLRSPNPADYPELTGYTRERIYDETQGGGALYLAAAMARTMDLQPGQLVLDLGCGHGATSMFLARRYDVRVIAVDLWTSATYLDERFAAAGYRDQIAPLNLDAAGRLPFADGYFDAIFSMNSFSFYGGSIEYLAHLLRHLKADGLLCVGSEVLSHEFTEEQLRNPPHVYSFKLPPPNEGVDVFQGDFVKQHTAAWWRDLFVRSGLLEVLECAELADADVLYEDMVLFEHEHGIDPFDVAICLEQIAWGQQHRPKKSLFTLTARKL
ncbi:MAG: methyltransferase domain-containing protein [Chloroflexi bacterium]|nr:methyltransferase domain-containing protein [Chloroflexota bacterium]